jgi:GT2 family glycosyltransferase
VIPFNVIGGPYTGEFMVGKPAEDLIGFVNCGVGMRPQAVRDAGYLDSDFFTYAEDWDLGIRIRNAGWRFHFDPGIRVHHRTADEDRDLEVRRTNCARNETWMAFKYYPATRVPLRVLRVLYWNIQAARDEGPRSSPWFAVRGVLIGCWRWRVARAKRQAIDPQLLEALELRSGLQALQPMWPRLRAMLLRLLGQ